jgi:hypothetical protein
MASLINAKTNVLPTDSPSSLGGNAFDYQEKMNGGAKWKGAKRKGAKWKGAQLRGGQGYGFEGKLIAPGVAEVSSYKGGSDMQRKSKRRNSKRRQHKSKRQSKSRR